MLTLQITGILLSLITLSPMLLSCSTPSTQAPTEKEDKIKSKIDVLDKWGLCGLERQQALQEVTFLATLNADTPLGKKVSHVRVTHRYPGPAEEFIGHFYYRDDATLPITGITPGTREKVSNNVVELRPLFILYAAAYKEYQQVDK